MHTINNVTEETWALFHNSNDVFHIGHLTIGISVVSGQPNFEKFATKEECEKRIEELNPKYFAEYKKRKEKSE